MIHYGRLALIRLNCRVRKLEAVRKGGRRPASGTAAAFPVFAERQKREFDASSCPMRITEHGTLKYLAVNDAAVKLYGYTREEFLELTIFQTRHPEEHDQLLATFAEPTGDAIINCATGGTYTPHRDNGTPRVASATRAPES